MVTITKIRVSKKYGVWIADSKKLIHFKSDKIHHNTENVIKIYLIHQFLLILFTPCRHMFHYYKKNLGLLNQKSKSLSHREYIYCRYRICKQMYQIAAE